MVEWGNYWAKGIRMRDYKNTEAFMGTFSQVGDLYNVKHIWCYDSLVDRQKVCSICWPWLHVTYEMNDFYRICGSNTNNNHLREFKNIEICSEFE